MGTKRKAEDEILEIHSDDDEDSDVQIQEKPIPIVTVDDDEDESRAPEPDSPKTAASEQPKTMPSTPPPPIIKRHSDGEVNEPDSTEQEKQAPLAADATTKMDENLLLNMKFRDQDLFQLFRGSLTEYLKTTFQLKLAGQEVDVLQNVETASIQVLRRQGAAPLPEQCTTPALNVATADKEKAAADERDSGIFVIDSTPAKTAKGGPIIPSYKKAMSKVLDNSPTASPDSAAKRPKPRQLCWNCDGDHGLRDCKEPRNFAKINKMKQEFIKRTDRYHVDLEQKYGHICPGRITHELRQALGLKKHDLPMHIYRMRMYGYPPGWLEDAQITHSGLQLFDSNGAPVQDSDESDGEVDNIKMKYDVRKIISFPGFNAPAGKEFYDDSKYYGVPPRMEHQSREEMIRNLEGTLVQGYRRKKLRLAPSAQGETSHESADMDLDNPEDGFMTLDSVGQCDNIEGNVNSQTGSLPASQPSVNGAPDAAAEPMDDEPEDGEVDDDGEIKRPELEEKPQDAPESNGNDENDKDDSLILMEEETEIICLDDTRPCSPSLDDLRRKQQELLQQLEAQSPRFQNLADISNDDSLLEDVLMVERLAEEQEANDAQSTSKPPPSISSGRVPAFIPGNFVFSVPMIPPLIAAPPPPPADETTERPPEPECLNMDEIKMTKTPFIDDPATMGLKTMSLGTPILTAFSPFNTLPCGDAFSKGVSDVINFENLPNSTGKYERMKSLLTKVRTVITAHNGEAEEDESR